MRFAILVCALSLLLSSAARATEPLAPEAAAKALVERWLAAQNRGAFSDYEALYAPRLTGVRRTGTSVVRLDRNGWMQDRRRMFERPMQVEIADLVLSPAAGGVIAQFVQTFTQGTYKDSGTKVLMLARGSDGELRIAREELLRSDIDPTRASVSAPYLHLLAEGVVLHSGAPAGWARGALELLAEGPPVKVRSAVDESKLPESYRAFLGKPLQLVGPTGPLCTAKVKGFALLHRVDAYPESVAIWQGKDAGSDGKRRRQASATIAREAWAMGETRHLLIAELELGGAACGKLGAPGGPTWARAATEPTLKIRPAQVATAAWQQAALAQARKLPEYVRLQTEYTERGTEPRKAHWEAAYDDRPEVRVMERGDGTRLLSVLLAARGGCADFGGTLWAVWEVKGGPGRDASYKLLLASTSSVGIPAAAVDIDGDGREELLTNDGILRRRGERLGELEELEIPSFICPC